ncbi:class I SAM-dependent methyltransferase [Geoglobus acetivorans]|uniref:tRNA (guanine(37)-N(1))-methyltransferase n=1 Tax=Geoglobus acetivorans TaxID=565033 RepID=A0A0A7GAQ2_GEOAI|nr:tRNA (Guanine37-N1) -methyltransferase [Geoglobus acetivorans]
MERMTLKDYLKGKARDSDIALLRRGFEIIGDVMIIDLPEQLMYLKNDIVEWVRLKHKHVKTILRKTGEVSGEFRVARYEVIYGGETETVAKEHGCRFRVDPTKAYYTVKLSGERERVARLVKDGERVLVMFAGVGPYAIVIAKLARPSEVIGVELNPEAVRYFRENVKINKVENVVKVVEGDVREVVPELDGAFDRILMPAPYNAGDFLDIALKKIRSGGTLHFYTFSGEEEIENKKKEIVGKIEDTGYNARILFWRECGNFAPRVNRYVLDIEILKP